VGVDNFQGVNKNMTKDVILDFFPEMANVKDEHLHIMRGHLLMHEL
jgi:hypothetical protein